MYPTSSWSTILLILCHFTTFFFYMFNMLNPLMSQSSDATETAKRNSHKHSWCKPEGIMLNISPNIVNILFWIRQIQLNSCLSPEKNLRSTTASLYIFIPDICLFCTSPLSLFLPLPGYLVEVSESILYVPNIVQRSILIQNIWNIHAQIQRQITNYILNLEYIL